jgi:serine/threonine protein kinase/tetratricopeptide (TPR) repeat protein
MSQSSDDRNPVERLAEEFLERYRRGEHPALTEYTDHYREWAEEIRERFPALVMMEQLKPAAPDITGSFIEGSQADPSRVPERLGDFRILREVGRGGMGIVFEAEQESLGRHVALKVLPAHALLNPRHLQRFLREARAAAKLHHTNIVPVFGVGEGQGLHYYVMQFITGSGLHEVIDELRRLKSGGSGKPPSAKAIHGVIDKLRCIESPGRSTTDAGASLSPSPTASLHQVARGLLAGKFATAPAEAAAHNGELNAQPAANPSLPASTDIHDGSSILSGSGCSFTKAVARVGLQVAEALGYAHGQGVLHRDIKPSNLLLDGAGTVWVTDFGLAKAMADTDGLTHEGDILGTLRYMAPERFHGQADARSDLYALGLTLFELLTLRPAFDQDDRDQLIHQVTTEVPPRPRALNPEVPRDLETIVLKAIEHDPARRYQDAEDLAEDLQRFLADRPIKARPVGALERAGKWAQRKPAIAGLLASLAVAVVVGFCGITWQWREAVGARNHAQANEVKARTNFEHALETVNTFCTQVSEEQLLDEPGMQPLRRRLLELARRYYQQFQREQGEHPDPKLMKELALSFMRSGIITGELGDLAQAHIELLRARDLLQELYLAAPKDRELRFQLARCQNELWNPERQTDVMGSARRAAFEHTLSSVSLAESLVAEDPNNPDYLQLLGRSYRMSAFSYSHWGQYMKSEAALRRAIGTLERAHHAAPQDGEAARSLALAHADLGLVFQWIGYHAQRAQLLEKGRVIFTTLEERFPRVRRYRLDRAECLVQLGGARIDLGQYLEAERRLREAEERLGRLVAEDREAVEVRYWLAVAKQGLGRVALARECTTAADKLLREAIGLHEQASGTPLARRDLLARARSYFWLARDELQAGRKWEIPTLREQLGKALGSFKEQLDTGVAPPHQSRELAQIESLIEPLLDSARSTTAAARIAAQRREVQAWQTLADRQPDNPALRFEDAWSRVRLAELQEQNRQVAEARSSLDGALPVLEKLAQAETENLRRRQGLALAWETLGRVQARSGQMTEARQAAEQAVRIAEDLARRDSAYQYDLACMLNLRGRVSSSQADGAAAVAALRQAIAAGFDNEHLLRTDPRLDGLRSRPDFPALMTKPK